MAAETLHLFDPDPANRPQPSSTETPVRLSRLRTPTTPVRTEAASADARASTPADQALEVAAEAALAAGAAAAELDHAITAARADGHSWRTIATVTGIPHQTLHRRARQHSTNGMVDARKLRSARIQDE